MATPDERIDAVRAYLDTPYKCPLTARRYRLAGEETPEEDPAIQWVAYCNSPLEVEWESEYYEYSHGPSYPVFICKHPEYGENHTEYLNSDDLNELWEIRIRMEERAAVRRALKTGAPA